MEGQGEILRIEDRPTHGTRDLTIDSNTKQITDEIFRSLPEPYRVARYGYSPNKVALTFDDGPDPEWTPKILDVLKQEHAQATFFLIGIQTDKFSGLAKRIYNEGHTIGNHTFTHPDVSNISSTYLKVELNLTERLFASLVGVRVMLLRPPYAIDEEPDTADQVRPLETAQDLGYTTVGNRIDPNDWSDKPRRHTAEEISAFVLAHLPPCSPNDQHCGNDERRGEQHAPRAGAFERDFHRAVICYDPWPLRKGNLDSASAGPSGRPRRRKCACCPDRGRCFRGIWRCCSRIETGGFPSGTLGCSPRRLLLPRR